MWNIIPISLESRLMSCGTNVHTYIPGEEGRGGVTCVSQDIRPSPGLRSQPSVIRRPEDRLQFDMILEWCVGVFVKNPDVIEVLERSKKKKKKEVNSTLNDHATSYMLGNGAKLPRGVQASPIIQYQVHTTVSNCQLITCYETGILTILK